MRNRTKRRAPRGAGKAGHEGGAGRLRPRQNQPAAIGPRRFGAEAGHHNSCPQAQCPPRAKRAEARQSACGQGRSPARRDYIVAVLAMCAAVTLSNILVQYPFHYFGLRHILTYGAFTYPFAFLVNDITNRRFGAFMARRVVYAGFFAGLAVSWILAGPRLAIASGAAFLCAQLLDIFIFTPLRRKSWWQAPLAAAVSGSCLDTVLFFSIAFAPAFSFIDRLTGLSDSSLYGAARLFGVAAPIWLSLALGDFWVKLAMAFIMLPPYRAALAALMPNLYGFRREPRALSR